MYFQFLWKCTYILLIKDTLFVLKLINFHEFEFDIKCFDVQLSTEMNAVLNPAFYLQQGAINKVKQETAEYLLECVKAADHPGSGQ